MQTLRELAMCPNCSSTKLYWSATKVTCIDCLSEFRRDKEFVDFVESRTLSDLEVKALEVWSNDLHATALSAPAHFVQIQSFFPDSWQRSLTGNVLEIGCGSGTDTLHLSNLNESISFFAFDLGGNVAGLSKMLRNQKNTHIFRATALQIPLKNESINMVYSFGVFHHTSNPAKCFEEAYRVLSKKGALFFYVYSSHEDNPIKYTGIWLEMLLMQIFKSIPKWMHMPFLFIVSLPCLLLFSWPALIFKLCGLKRFAKKFPMYWGTTPASIFPDLKDRLLAPVNHRFKHHDLKILLELTLFHEIYIKKTPAGLFGYCVK